MRGRRAGTVPTILEWLGPLGAQVGGASVEGFDPALNVLSPFVLDRRGNLWFSSRPVSALGGPLPAGAVSVVKLAVGGEQGSLGCTQPFPNSTGAAGVLTAQGASAAANDNLTLFATGLPPFEFTLFLNSRTAGLTPGVGLTQASLCLASPVNRDAVPNQIRLSSLAGTAALQLDLALTPEGQGVTSILAGETWHFQAWHRDPGAVGGAHLTNSIALTFD